MEAIKTIPQQTKNFKIRSILINLDENVVSVGYSENGEFKMNTEDIISEWNAMTAQQKTIIRAFLKGIVKKCLSVTDSDISGDAL